MEYKNQTENRAFQEMLLAAVKRLGRGRKKGWPQTQTPPALPAALGIRQTA